MKKIFTLCLLLTIVCVKGWGQTALSPTGAGGFELGSTFSANGWTEAQPGSARQWFVGSAPTTYAGSYCAYIGSSTSYNGSGNGSVMHFYRDIAIPAGATNVSLSFYYKQPTTDNTYDYFYVFTTTTANTPVVGTVPGTGYTQRFINTATTYTNWTAITPIDLTALAGTTVRLVFTHSNDGNSPYANPAVDNISLTYTPSSPTLTASPTTLTFGSSCLNTSPTVQSTTVTGINLTGPVTIGGLTGYTYSTSSGGTYSNTLSLTPVSGAINQAVYVKFTPSAAQTYNGNIPISGGSATTINVGVTGTGVNSPPTVTSGTASSITYNSATVSGNLTAGCSATSAYGIEYSTTSGFANGAGTQVSSSNLSGGAFSSNLTGLAANTTYYFHAYATNGGGTSYGVQGSFTTAAPTYIDSWISMSTGAATWCAGEIRNVSITVKNTGTATWVSGSTGVNLSYYWSNQTRDANNRILPFTGAGLAPGQQQTITFPVTATSAGTYTLNFDLVKEQSCWFADNASGCSGPGNVVYVSPSQTISQAITAFSYPTTTATYCTGATITSNSPTVTGGTPTLYTVSPSLPAGLSINATTGVISGTPTTATAAANYTVTASNGCGTKTATVNLTVIAGVSGLTYTTASPSYCLNSAITSNTVSSITGGGTITYSVNPALPAGLSINTNTGAITGAPTAVSASATYTVTATNGCSSTTKNLTVTVNALPTGVSATATPSAVCAGSSVTLNSLPSASSTLLSQNFNNGLGSWTATNSSSGGTLANAAWTLRSDGYSYDYTFHSNDNTQFLMSNSDAQGIFQDSTHTDLYSPTFSTVGLTTCSLDFYQYYRYSNSLLFYDLEASVYISTNGGSTYALLHNYTNDGMSQGSAASFAHSILDISAYVGYSNVKLRFEYDSYYGYYWALDNITVTGANPFTYAWTSSPAGFTAATQNTTAAPTVSTTYTVKVTNSNGCSASANAAVTVNPLPTATITTSSATACLNGTAPIITFTGATGTAPYTFIYKINNGTNQTITSAGTNSSVTLPVSTATATSYTYNLVSVKDASSTTCSNTISNQSVTVAVTALPAPTFITTPTTPYCVATNFDYATQAGQSSYVWTFSGTLGTDYQIVAGGTSTTSAVRVKWLTSGSKTVTVNYNNGNGCTGASAAASTITVNPLPTATLSGSQTICSGSSANLNIVFTGTSPWTVQYTNSVNTYTASSSTSPATASVSPTSNTTYYLGTSSVTDASGCASGATNGSAAIMVTPLPTAAITPASGSACEGTSVQVNITGTAGATISYKLNGTTQPVQTLPYPFNSPTNAGTYTYALQSVTASGCTATISNSSSAITINPYPVVNAIGGGNYIQTGNNIQLTNTTTGGVWASNTAAVATVGGTSGSPVTVTGVSEGLTNITYSVTSNSCTTTKSQQVRVYNPDYITQAGGNFSTAGTWKIDRDDNTFVTSVPVPSGTNYTSIRVQNALTLDQDFQVGSGRTFALITGGTLNVASGKTFSSLGSVDFGGKAVTVKSDATGTGSIGQMASDIAKASNVTVERYTDGATTGSPSTSRRAWRLITSPVSGQTIQQAWQENGVNNTGYGTLITGENIPDAATATAQGYDFTGAGFHASIKRYVPAATSGSWTPLSAGTNIAVRTEQAYMLFVRGDRTIGANLSSSSVATLRANGTLLQGTQPSVPLSGGKFTLLGNPYASSIDFSSLYGYNSTVIANQFYLWNSKLGTYGAYILVNKNGSSYQATPSPLTGTGIASNDSYRYIPSGSGFFVSAATGVTSGSVTIREADKAAGNVPPVSPFRVVPAATNVRELIVNLNLRDSLITLADGFRAKFSPDYKGNEEDNSIGKIYNFNENLNVVRGGKAHIIEAHGEVEKTDTLFVKMWFATRRSYQLQIAADNFISAPATRAWLQDNYAKTKQPIDLSGSITNIDFDVNSDSLSASPDRFRIVFENSSSALPVAITKVSAQLKNGGAEVTWTTANETNIKGYTVEKSNDDGKTFIAVGTQQPARNNSQAAITAYSGFDAQPKTGNNLYRIRIEGKDGSITYSEVVKVTIGASGSSIQITLYPNPVREGKANLQLTNLTEGTYLVGVYTGSGQTVYQKKVYITLANTTQTEQLVLGNNLSQGSYQIKVADSKGNVLFTDKLIVAR